MHHNGYTEISYVIVATPFYMDVESVLVGKSLMEGGLVTPAGDTALSELYPRRTALCACSRLTAS